VEQQLEKWWSPELLYFTNYVHSHPD